MRVEEPEAREGAETCSGLLQVHAAAAHSLQPRTGEVYGVSVRPFVLFLRHSCRIGGGLGEIVQESAEGRFATDRSSR
ncbi:hypothetical protein BE04_48400 [Sorangium cellulosum]|uniref:Uncharacterized protein n=1 Tax=Sorangium cellulosum TaxID=56 RepID=A0A150PUB9_SORCE|nr:hypothetical protein BE04_48400 [Sorangium cellulosum]